MLKFLIRLQYIDRRYIFLAMAVGVLIGRLAPGVSEALDRVSHQGLHLRVDAVA